jgi:non-homologous end joining protein Ku
MAMINARVAGEHVTVTETKRPAATNVVNLMDVLQRSLEQSKRGGAAAAKPKAAAPKKSASAAKPKRKKSAA